MGGPEYIVNFIVGFTGEEKEQAGVTLYENKYYPANGLEWPSLCGVMM